MPLLAYHGTLPFDFWDLLVSLFDMVSNMFWYLTAFLASSAVFPNGGIGLESVYAQYLLGLGMFALGFSKMMLTMRQVLVTLPGIPLSFEMFPCLTPSMQPSRGDQYDGAYSRKIAFSVL